MPSNNSKYYVKRWTKKKTLSIQKISAFLRKNIVENTGNSCEYRPFNLGTWSLRTYPFRNRIFLVVNTTLYHNYVYSWVNTFINCLFCIICNFLYFPNFETYRAKFSQLKRHRWLWKIEKKSLVCCFTTKSC